MVEKFVHKELVLSDMPDILLRTAISSTTVLFLIAAANVFGWVIIFEEVPQELTVLLTQISENPFVFMLLVNLALLLIGAFIDSIAALILVVPLLLPIAIQQYGIDPFHFGVVVCINLVLGILTPPVGTGLFISATLARVSPGKIFIELLPFLLVTICVLVLLSWQPQLVTFLIAN